MFAPAQAMTFDNATVVLEEGLRAIASGQTSIDLARVDAIDSSAVAVLLAWQRAARANATSLALMNPPANLVGLSVLYGVADLLQLGTAAGARSDLPHH
ncbi:phospholipid transport system transporter-binding protein [Actimicrobium sp. GrIS 1.19]|uniref:STAS domain-containing protein n=1 Tax=Actimicrobium sp. GrIS 1.19 TaxID=3071708 RepID=UPI002E026E58|nr:phospholipid transport system transporter-binding protein [Actimicrobium sp. GrIS 1.19]